MTADEDPRVRLSLERIVFFSDAVMAIAITLLAIDIRVPNLDGTNVAETLPAALGHLWPFYLSFVVSFVVIGMNWMIHHRLFNDIERYDPGLIWLNLLFLFCVVVLPFTSSVMGEYGHTAIAGTVYAGSVIATGLSITLLRQYAARHGLLVADVTPERVRAMTMRALLTPLIFLASIPVLWLVSPFAGTMIWLATPLLLRVVRSRRHES